MNKAMIAEAETLIGTICTTIESGNHSGELVEAAKRLRSHIPTLRKAAVTIEPADGAATTAKSLADLEASWETRLATAMENAPAHLRGQARDAELAQLIKELRHLQNDNVVRQMQFRDVSAEVAALKSDNVDLSKLSPRDRTLYLIKEERRNPRHGTGFVFGR